MQYRRRPRRSRHSGVLLAAIGAVTGLALGVVIAERIGGLDGLRRIAGAAGGRSERRGGPDDSEYELGESGDTGNFGEVDSDEFDEFEDNLAPESISHLHLAAAVDHRSNPRTNSGHAHARQQWSGAGNHRRSGTPRWSAQQLSQSSEAMADELEERILEAFRNDPILANRSVDISVTRPGEVELTGWLKTDREIGYAVAVTRGVPGVTAVANSLAVNTDR